MKKIIRVLLDLGGEGNTEGDTQDEGGAYRDVAFAYSQTEQ